MPRALVIDDEPAVTAIIGRFLQGAGIEVEAAASGPEGLRKAVSTRPDVVILDIMMPEMDGYEVCRRLRRDPRTARAAVLVLTARGQFIDKQIALQAGADSHVAKPFNGKALVQEVQRLLAERTLTAPPLGYQILVLRLREGSGATTVATNLALCLAREEGCLTVVADGVLQGGQIENRLGLPLGGSWQDEPRSDADSLVAYLLRHASGLFALPTPPPQEGPVTPARLAQVLQSLREWHDYVVVDTPFNLGLLAPVLVRSSSLVLLLVTPEPSLLRVAKTSLVAIRRLGARALQILPVLRLTGGEEGIEQQVEEVLGLPVAASLPSSPQDCTQAVASGEPVVLSYPDSRLTAAFEALAQVVVRNAHEQPPRRVLR